MSESDHRPGEAQGLRESLAGFLDAALRINQSLDLDMVLREVLDCARELTGGRYALISLLDGNGVFTGCATSGMTAKESDEFRHRALDRCELYDLVTGVEGLVRVDDFQSYLDAHDLPEFLAPFAVSEPMAFLAAPIRLYDERSGVICLAEKPQGFNAEDEETLTVFASLVALVVSYVHRFEGERRARADLEGVVTTAPMIVLVFDADTGAVTSINREARRLMGALDVSFATVEELIQAGTFRLPDGREVSADGVSLQKLLLSPEPVRDLEVIAEFGDGRRVALLVNATFVVGADNRAGSVVVAAQDLTPLAQMEQLPPEFLARIGYQFRSPLAAIKGSAASLLQSAAARGDAETVQFLGIINEQADNVIQLLSSLVDTVPVGSALIGTERVDDGAADGLVETLSLTGLAARARAALGASGLNFPAAVAASSPDPASLARFEFGDLCVDYRARLVHVAGRRVDLAPTEYRLLAHLAANAGTLVPRDRLIAAVWGAVATADPNRLRTVVKNLRKKLGDDARDPRYIFTVARVGYRMPNPDYT